jgi:hypothetical protein
MRRTRNRQSEVARRTMRITRRTVTVELGIIVSDNFWTDAFDGRGILMKDDQGMDVAEVERVETLSGDRDTNEESEGGV